MSKRATKMHPTQTAYLAAKAAYVTADKALDVAALAAGIDFADDINTADEADMMSRYDALADSLGIPSLVATLRAAEVAMMERGISFAKRFSPRKAAELDGALELANRHAGYRAKLIEFSLRPTP